MGTFEATRQARMGWVAACEGGSDDEFGLYSTTPRA
jgi:hypothetical protein